jgi:hypothetical protein
MTPTSRAKIRIMLHCDRISRLISSIDNWNAIINRLSDEDEDIKAFARLRISDLEAELALLKEI